MLNLKETLLDDEYRAIRAQARLETVQTILKGQHPDYIPYSVMQDSSQEIKICILSVFPEENIIPYPHIVLPSDDKDTLNFWFRMSQCNLPVWIRSYEQQVLSANGYTERAVRAQYPQAKEDLYEEGLPYAVMSINAYPKDQLTHVFFSHHRSILPTDAWDTLQLTSLDRLSQHCQYPITFDQQYLKQ